MIVGKIQGGLGNQMFQFATGYYLAQQQKSKLYLDLSFYNLENVEFPREFELRKFNVNFKVFRKWHSWRKFNLVVENTVLPYNENIENSIDRHLYLDGYWQSEKYFSSIRKELIDCFEPKVLPGHLKSEVALLSRESTVAVHIRRGDYVHHDGVNKTHFVCTPDYYIKSISQIREQLKNPSFCFFSDDIPWCREQFGDMPNVTFMEGKSGFEDLFLMKQCHHFIISNSSFSWWAAWLSDRPGKRVLTPSKWKVDPTNTIDVIPDDWQKVDVGE